MGQGNIKAILKDGMGVTINGKVTVKKGSDVRTCSSAAGTCTIFNLPFGTWAVSAKTFNGAASGGPKYITIAAGETYSIAIILKPKSSSAITAQFAPPLQPRAPAAAPPLGGHAYAAITTGTPWIEIPEDKAQALVEKHGGDQGDRLTEVEPAATDLPLPDVPLAINGQIFQAPDGWKVFLAQDELGMEYYFVHQGTQYAGLKPWHYAVIGAVGAGGGALVLRKRVGIPLAAAIGGGASLAGAVIVSFALRKANSA